MFYTNQLAVIQASVDGISLPKVTSWTTWSGGDPQAATSQFQPGNVMNTVAQPGPVTMTTVTVTRPYSSDLDAFIVQLRGSLNGKMHASYTTTDAQGNPSAVTVTISGILKEVQTPSWDAKSGETAMLGLVMEPNG